MGQKRYTTEQIIHKLREAEVELAKGRTIGEACKQIGILPPPAEEQDQSVLP
jgi:hypothetical protein